MKAEALYELLEQKCRQYNQPGFIPNDPISIPHRFSKKQDIEIMGFIAATLAWGQRKTILHNCSRLIEAMDGAPYDFILNHREQDLARMEGFVHRTFNDTDLLYFIHFFSQYYRKHASLEDAFANGMQPGDTTTEDGLNHFKATFFSVEDAPERTRKHVASPAQKSACKRINMFLRWMVRSDKQRVDFGIWKRISPAQLVCPLDTHVHRVATFLGMINRTQADWECALQLTARLREFCPEDPVKYDFALFGMGVEEKAGKAFDAYLR